MNQFSNQLILAEKIAKKVHEEQKDKAGVAYFEHVKTVSKMGENINEQITGYLHDVIEDGGLSLSDLDNYGFSTFILNAVEAITRKDNESWNTYIRRVGENSLATKVKLNDLAHNSDLLRISQPQKVDFDRVEKYKQAISKLEKKLASHKIVSIDFVSDLHVNHYVQICSCDNQWKRETKEFIWENYLVDQKSEAIVLAGDYSEINRQSIWLIESFAEAYDHVLVVFGNHDHYMVGKEIMDVYEGSSENRVSEVVNHFKNSPNIHFLQNKTVEIGGLTFAGSRLWYDIKSAENLKFYNLRSNDSKYIFPDPSTIYKKYHEADMAFYESLEHVDVMITHVPPVIPPSGGKISELYVTPVKKFKAKHWICGHQHLVENFKIEDTVFHMNAVGYPSEENTPTTKTFICEED